MRSKLSILEGSLFALAVGDAMGYTIDRKSFEEICQDYGPNGLLGYDLVNGSAQVSSHTQIAAFVCNALLIGMTRGHFYTNTPAYMRYISLGMREWAETQRYKRDPEKRLCWVSKVPALRHHSCLDARLLDTLRREKLGTPEDPCNRFSSPSSLTAAIPVGLLFHPDRMAFSDLGKLGAEAVALTNGDPMAFLSGAMLAYLIAGIIHDDDTPLKAHFSHAADAVAAQFGRQYPQAAQLQALIRKAISLSESSGQTTFDVMAQLGLDTAAEVLAGAVYACLASEGDFDTAMIIAVNHSGRSSAVGALTGAILGAAFGKEALPEFYLDCLEPAAALQELAKDLEQGFHTGRAMRLFDDDWEHKYTHGELVEKSGWYEA